MDNQTTQKRKIACIHHSVDLDGWMSGAIVKLWAEGKGSIDMFGFNYGDEEPDLEGYDIVIMCDIRFDLKTMLELTEKSNKHEIEFIWIDHHISAINDLESERLRSGILLPKGLRDPKYAACELTWYYFFPNFEMPEIVRLLGRYDCFGHKGTEEEELVLDFQYGARQAITGVNDAYQIITLRTDLQEKKVNQILSAGQVIYAYLKKMAEQIYARGYQFDLWIPKIGNFQVICINEERFNPVNFGIDYHKDDIDAVICYWFDGSSWKFSIYNDNGKVDVSLIAKHFGGGGHKGASGFICNDINKWMPYWLKNKIASEQTLGE